MAASVRLMRVNAICNKMEFLNKTDSYNWIKAAYWRGAHTLLAVIALREG
jgi:hypothetical protein